MPYRRYFSSAGCLGTLATSNRDGVPNAAVIGSARLLDGDRLVVALGNNRTLKNLEENPRAVFVVTEPGPSLLEWRGVRLYLEKTEIVREGELLEQLRCESATAVGRRAAQRLRAAVIFRIEGDRPLLDPFS